MITLEIITPDALVLSTEADQVVLPTESGETGILTGHVPMVTKVVAGELQVINGGNTEFIAVDHGFAKVLGNTISVLTEAAIDVKDIDLSEVESAQARAEEAPPIAAAEDHVFDRARIEIIALGQALDDVGAEIGRVNARETAAAFSDRCANRVDEICLCHADSSAAA